MTDAYIVGVDMIKFGRFPDRTVPQIGAQAALMALDDCGLTIHVTFCGGGESDRATLFLIFLILEGETKNEGAEDKWKDI